jgi:eukaryotic-like serine/threonine-protein kinase
VAVAPRLGWLAAAVAALVVLPDSAALLAAALAAPPLLLWRRPLVWSLPAAAPLLGLAHVAGAYPAVAGQVRGPWTRAALGAIGLWWLLLAEPLLARDLAFGAPHGDVGTAVSSGALLLAPVWAVAALILPWVVAGRALVVDLVGAAVWATGLAVGTAAVADGVGLAKPRGLAAGALLAGALALIAAQARNTVNAEHDSA